MISEVANEICKERYYMDDETSWDEMAVRVGCGVGGACGNRYWSDSFVDIIGNLQFIPGGRILRNTGREHGSLSNCFNIPIGDSREEIGDCYKHALILWGEGGGVGVTFSTLRPRGAKVVRVGGESSGLLSWVIPMNSIADGIKSGGQRRAASIAIVECWHPEVIDVINAKYEDGLIKNFNISIGVNHRFIEAVRNDEEWTLTWQGKEWYKLPAKELWKLMVTNMCRNGEPGILNMDTLRTNNSWYFAPITGCNPCGEVPLEDYGCCNLGSIVLPRFVDSAGRIKWKELEEVIHLAVRFLDMVIDINRHTIQQIKQTTLRSRRLGLGIMGLADILFRMGIRYGSRDATDFCDKLFKFIRNIAYEASVKLAIEKGTFPAYDTNLYNNSKFVRTLPRSLRMSIRDHGIRNVTLLAMAPTGTISLIPEVTSGIEPLAYKAWRSNDNALDRCYIHPLYREYMHDDRMPDWFVDSLDITPMEHLDMQATIQQYVDGAVSKTINLPSTFTSKQLSDVLLESIQDVKGVTVYRDGSKKNQPVLKMSKAEALSYTEKENAPNLQECSIGGCE